MMYKHTNPCAQQVDPYTAPTVEPTTLCASLGSSTAWQYTHASPLESSFHDRCPTSHAPGQSRVIAQKVQVGMVVDRLDQQVG